MTAWNSFTTDSTWGGITTEVITYPGGNGDQIHAYVSRPTGECPRRAGHRRRAPHAGLG